MCKGLVSFRRENHTEQKARGGLSCAEWLEDAALASSSEGRRVHPHINGPTATEHVTPYIGQAIPLSVAQTEKPTKINQQNRNTDGRSCTGLGLRPAPSGPPDTGEHREATLPPTKQKTGAS